MCRALGLTHTWLQPGAAKGEIRTGNRLNGFHFSGFLLFTWLKPGVNKILVHIGGKAALE